MINIRNLDYIGSSINDSLISECFLNNNEVSLDGNVTVEGDLIVKGKIYLEEKKMKNDKIKRTCEVCGYTEELPTLDIVTRKGVKEISKQEEIREFLETEMETKFGKVTITVCDKCLEEAKQNEIKNVFNKK